MTEELVFSPAKPGGGTFLMGLVGQSGSGKTLSAILKALGITDGNGRLVGFVDTENRRALEYAREYDFDHLSISDPFRPEKYMKAIEASKSAGHKVLIIDSASHEWAGIGGMLDWHEEELSRMAGSDFKKREKLTYAAWIKPKMAHKAMMQRLLSLNMHIIFCFRAEPKIALEKNSEGKIVPVDRGLQPIAEKNMIYDMTMSFLLRPENPGVPEVIKLQGNHAHLIRPGERIDQETGRRIAAYARGEDVPKPQPKESAKNIQAADEIIARFEGVKTRDEHAAAYDDLRAKIEWFREKKAWLYERISVAMNDAFARTEGTEPQQEEEPTQHEAA